MSALKKRMTGLLQRKDSEPQAHLPQTQSNGGLEDIPHGASLAQVMDLFFRYGGTSDHVGALSLIPDRTFESTANAQEAAKIMRKKMASWNFKAAWEVYNCIMLIGILARHEQGHMFTSAIDDRFAGTVKQLLRDVRPESLETRMLIRETIAEFDETIGGRVKEPTAARQSDRDILQARWKDDRGILKLTELRKDPKNWYWLREQQQRVRAYGPGGAQQGTQQQGSNGGPALPTVLPNVLELSERLKEANTSANILEQSMFAHGSDLQALMKDELFREFSVRCDAAKKSLQRYLDLIDSGDSSQHYDQATIHEIVTTKTRVTAVTRLQEQKQDDYNALRSQTRSPAAQTQIPPPVRPAAARSANSAARLEDPFDDSNEVVKAGQSLSAMRLGASTTGNAPAQRASLALDTGGSGTSTPHQASTESVEEHRVSAESEDKDRPRRYVF